MRLDDIDAVDVAGLVPVGEEASAQPGGWQDLDDLTQRPGQREPVAPQTLTACRLAGHERCFDLGDRDGPAPEWQPATIERGHWHRPDGKGLVGSRAADTPGPTHEEERYVGD